MIVHLSSLLNKILFVPLSFIWVLNTIRCKKNCPRYPNYSGRGGFVFLPMILDIFFFSNTFLFKFLKKCVVDCPGGGLLPTPWLCMRNPCKTGGECFFMILDIFFQTPSFFRFLKKCVVVRDAPWSCEHKLPLIRRGTKHDSVWNPFFFKGQKNMGVLSSISPLFPTFFLFSFEQTPF